ncbi:hypothetical protein CRG98_049651, partial [Punica granatum]
MEVGSGQQIGNPRSRIDRDLELEIPSIPGLGPPIGDLDPALEVFDILCRCRQPRWWIGVVIRQPKLLSPFFRILGSNYKKVESLR